MTTTSIVLLRFKPEANAQEIKDICGSMLSLKDRCLHSKTQKPYIKSYTGGVDNSIEGLQNGFTHVFTIQFENTEDRDYCVNHDTVHQDIVGSLDSIVEKAQVIDFTHGIF